MGCWGAMLTSVPLTRCPLGLSGVPSFCSVWLSSTYVPTAPQG